MSYQRIFRTAAPLFQPLSDAVLVLLIRLYILISRGTGEMREFQRGYCLYHEEGYPRHI